MRIKYENRFSDIFLFNAVHQFLSPALQGFYVAFFGLVFFAESAESAISTSVATAFFWYCGLWTFQWLFNALYLFSRNNRSVLTAHTIEVLDEALLEETQFNRSFYYWPGIVKVVSRPWFVAVYVTPHIAHVIPNRAFSCADERERFLAAVKEKLRAAVCRART